MMRQINIFAVSFVVVIAIIFIAEVKSNPSPSDGQATAKEELKNLLDVALESRNMKVVKIVVAVRIPPSKYLIEAILTQNEKQAVCFLGVSTPDGLKLDVQSIECNEPHKDEAKVDELFYNPRLG